MYSCPLHNWYSDYGSCPSCLQLTTTADGTQPYEPLEQQLQSEKEKVKDLEEINAALLRSKLKFNDTVMAYEEKVSKLREALENLLTTKSWLSDNKEYLAAKQTLKETE